MPSKKEETQQEEEWQDAKGGLGQVVRWNEKATSKKQEENTVYVGMIVKGLYAKKLENVGENESTMYVIDTEEHGRLAVWEMTVLADDMEVVPVGSEIRIECLGEQKPKKGGRAYVSFDVKFRPAPMQSASTDDEDPGDPEF